jgi:hypothetical protein
MLKVVFMYDYSNRKKIKNPGIKGGIKCSLLTMREAKKIINFMLAYLIGIMLLDSVGSKLLNQ